MLSTALAAGCLPASSFPTARRLPDDARRPDGVAVDPTSAPPPARPRADVTDGVVTLRTPLGHEDALRTIRSFFEAVTAEDLGRLSAVATPTALVSDTRNGALDRVQNYGFLWRQRFAKHDFLGLEATTLYRESEIETFDLRDPASLPAELQLASAGEAPEPEDVIVRVHILAPTSAGTRLFGDTLTFWLRRDAERYVVGRIAEEVPL